MQINAPSKTALLKLKETNLDRSDDQLRQEGISGIRAHKSETFVDTRLYAQQHGYNSGKDLSSESPVGTYFEIFTASSVYPRCESPLLAPKGFRPDAV
jgi:hypothetical protein